MAIKQFLLLFCYTTLSLCASGCVALKPMQAPVRVEWESGFGDLRIADDGSCAMLATNSEIRQGEIFVHNKKVFFVIRNVGARDFRFCYLMEAK
jgi:hypothetical protein